MKCHFNRVNGIEEFLNILLFFNISYLYMKIYYICAYITAKKAKSF